MDEDPGGGIGWLGGREEESSRAQINLAKESGRRNR